MADTQGIENLWRSARQGEPGLPLEQNRDQPGGEEEELEESFPPIPRAEFSSEQWQLASQRQQKEKGVSG